MKKVLQELVEKAREAIIQLYIGCEEDFQKGLQIFEAIVKAKMLETAQRRIKGFEKKADEIKKILKKKHLAKLHHNKLQANTYRSNRTRLIQVSKYTNLLMTKKYQLLLRRLLQQLLRQLLLQEGSRKRRIRKKKLNDIIILIYYLPIISLILGFISTALPNFFFIFV